MWVVNSIPIIDLNVNLHILIFDRQILNPLLLDKTLRNSICYLLKTIYSKTKDLMMDLNFNLEEVFLREF